MSTTENREAEFLAKITTGTTHEIRNVLAIIKESAGLLEDLVRAAEDGGSLKPSKLMRSIERIGAQVERGAELLTTLNRFAHGLDQEQERIDLHEEASQVALMCRRLARQKSLQVKARQVAADVGFTVNRMALEIALFRAVECCMEQLPEHGAVVMHSGQFDGFPTLDFVCEFGEGVAVPSPHAAVGWTRFVEMADLLGATVETEGVQGHFRIRFVGVGAG